MAGGVWVTSGEYRAGFLQNPFSLKNVAMDPNGTSLVFVRRRRFTVIQGNASPAVRDRMLLLTEDLLVRQPSDCMFAIFGPAKFDEEEVDKLVVSLVQKFSQTQIPWIFRPSASEWAEALVRMRAPPSYVVEILSLGISICLGRVMSPPWPSVRAALLARPGWLRELGKMDIAAALGRSEKLDTYFRKVTGTFPHNVHDETAHLFKFLTLDCA